MTEPYTPTTEEIKERWVHFDGGPEATDSAEFDRWYVQEIERAEYSGYERAVREGLHR